MTSSAPRHRLGTHEQVDRFGRKPVPAGTSATTMPCRRRTRADCPWRSFRRPDPGRGLGACRVATFRESRDQVTARWTSETLRRVAFQQVTGRGDQQQEERKRRRQRGQGPKPRPGGTHDRAYLPCQERQDSGRRESRVQGQQVVRSHNDRQRPRADSRRCSAQDRHVPRPSRQPMSCAGYSAETGPPPRPAPHRRDS